MSDFDNSRVDKFEKRRKNTKSLSIFIVLGSILLVVLLAIIFLGGDDKDKNESAGSDNDNTPAESEDSGNTKDKPSTDEQSSSKDDNSSVTDDDSTANEDTSNTEEDSSAQAETEQVEPSGDNVKQAYTNDWKPVGTEQSGQHTINYNEGTQDRNEMIKAASVATGLDKESLIFWWVESNGDQKVITTVSNHDNTVYYRAYLSWVNGQGWQPIKVEELKENDQEHRFE